MSAYFHGLLVYVLCAAAFSHQLGTESILLLGIGMIVHGEAGSRGCECIDGAELRVHDHVGLVVDAARAQMCTDGCCVCDASLTLRSHRRRRRMYGRTRG